MGAITGDLSLPLNHLTTRETTATMTYFITPGSNRYYINKEQRQLLIASELEVMTDDGWPQCDVNRRESWLKDLNNRDLVEEICGNQWRGFVGQTTAFA